MELWDPRGLEFLGEAKICLPTTKFLRDANPRKALSFSQLNKEESCPAMSGKHLRTSCLSFEQPWLIMRKNFCLGAYLRLLMVFSLSPLWIGPAAAQSVRAESAFHKIEGKYLDIITDLPLDDEMRDLPRVFEAAMPIWCSIFGARPKQVEDWHCTACFMLDRTRFESAGLIPDHLPDFPYGYQSGDQLWVTEQPSTYYRRHLLLHEGTHWFMGRKYGQNGPPWLMEGVAEWLGTHRWDSRSQALTMGIIPKDKDDVPLWGRISLIQKQLAAGLAPSLETIMRYGNTAHQQVDAYAWSWALVVFLRNHPHTKEAFQSLLRRPMRPDLTVTRWLFRQLRDEWPSIRQEWNAMLTELDYGYDPSQGMLCISADPMPLTSAQRQVSVEANQPWQASGILVRAGERLSLRATGQFVVCTEPRPWTCFPDGVTLEYQRGEPLGKLMMALVAPIPNEPDFSAPLTWQPIGAEASLVATQTGELHFRINERNAELSDNSGQITVHLQVE